MLGGLLARGIIGSLCFGDTRLIRLAESFLNDAQQVFLQELGYLTGFGMHDAVEAEVQVRLVKLEQLKLIGDLSLAELLLRGKLIKEIEDDALWSIHPNRYANMQEAAKSQGIGISEYSNIRDLYNIVFPYLCDTLGMNLALVWEEIGKSNFRDLTPTLSGRSPGRSASPGMWRVSSSS